MSVTDQLPSKVGQRVQDVFTDSRGWVRELGDRNGTKVAVVAWDAPELELGEDDSVFPVDALRVVKVIVIDADHYQDPAMHPAVEVSYTPEGGVTNYVVNTKSIGQHTLRGIDQVRLWLLGYSERA